jgi:hypothetical protein
MLRTKLDSTHYLLFVFMIAICILSSIFAYETGWNYAWYASRNHWSSRQMMRICQYADNPKDSDFIYGYNGTRYKPIKVEGGILLKIVEEGANYK